MNEEAVAAGERWTAWEQIIEGFCPGAHEDGRPKLRQVETSTGTWGYCEACRDGWRASSGGFMTPAGTPYGRTIEVHHVQDGSERVMLQGKTMRMEIRDEARGVMEFQVDELHVGQLRDREP